MDFVLKLTFVVLEYAADVWRVPLKGESNNYIHASFAHVRAA